MTDRIAVGVDPGGTTGWAVIRAPEDAIEPEAGWILDCGQVPSSDSADAIGVWRSDVVAAEAVYHAVSDVVVHYGGAHTVGIEDFILRIRGANAARSLLAPVRVTSALLAVGRERDWYDWRRSDDELPMRVQQPSAAKRICSDERMKGWGMWQSGQPHATDALRHAILAHRKP